MLGGFHPPHSHTMCYEKSPVPTSALEYLCKVGLIIVAAVLISQDGQNKFLQWVASSNRASFSQSSESSRVKIKAPTVAPLWSQKAITVAPLLKDVKGDDLILPVSGDCWWPLPEATQLFFLPLCLHGSLFLIHPCVLSPCEDTHKIQGSFWYCHYQTRHIPQSYFQIRSYTEDTCGHKS